MTSSGTAIPSWDGARHTLDAARPAALARQELERQRPVWLHEDYRMPSPRVWGLLTEGGTLDEPHAVFQSVMTGLVNAGWPAVYIRRAFIDHQHPRSTPGYWWLVVRGGRPSDFTGSLQRAQQRVGNSPADPARLRSSDGEQQQAVNDIARLLERAVLENAGVDRGYCLLPPGRVLPRIATLGVAAHLREHAAALRPTNTGVAVALACRDLALLIGCTPSTAAEQLRLLSTGDDDTRRVPLLRPTSAGRPTDATTYEVCLPGRLRRKRGQSPATTTQVSPQEDLCPTVAIGSAGLIAPDLAVVRHDAFADSSLAPGNTVGPVSISRTTGYLVALIASNLGGVSATDLAKASGLTESGVRESLRAVTTTPRKTTTVLLVTKQRGQPYILAPQSAGALFATLQSLAAQRGTTGVAARREAGVQEERRVYRERAGVRAPVFS